MARKAARCPLRKDGVHHFVFYGRKGECRCGHTIVKVSSGRPERDSNRAR